MLFDETPQPAFVYTKKKSIKCALSCRAGNKNNPAI